MDRAAEPVRADMLIVANAHDLLTTPESSREFAGPTGARLEALGLGAATVLAH